MTAQQVAIALAECGCTIDTHTEDYVRGTHPEHGIVQAERIGSGLWRVRGRRFVVEYWRACDLILAIADVYTEISRRRRAP